MQLPKAIAPLELYELKALYLLSLETPTDLCRFFKMPLSKLQEIINAPQYQEFVVKKKRGGSRLIFAPNKELKALQKQLNEYLQAYYYWVKPNEVHGFVINPSPIDKRCNIAENARPHTGKKVVLNIDLKNFFPSIQAYRVKRLFLSRYFPFDEQMATALTLLTTYRGSLPIGAPTSPVVSNFVCRRLDATLKQYCEQEEIIYTRYADDLTFSSKYKMGFDETLDLINLIKKNGFEINQRKLRYKSSNRKQTVTGLVVNEKVNIDRKMLKNIRAMLHDFYNNGLMQAAQRHFGLNDIKDEKFALKFLLRLEGYLNFVAQVRGEHELLYRNMLKKYYDAVQKQSVSRF